jgi:predicted helicase
LFELTATHEVIQNAQFSTDWFQFEKAISLLLEQHFKFTIQHRAARGKTDYGVDILATKYTGSELETWAVQCKCYKPSNLVDPSRIRELIGAMSDSQTEGMGQVRGMMVTTSAFSGEALRLAVKHGIQCISGEDLRAIMHAINVSNAAPVTH